MHQSLKYLNLSASFYSPDITSIISLNPLHWLENRIEYISTHIRSLSFPLGRCSPALAYWQCTGEACFRFGKPQKCKATRKYTKQTRWCNEHREVNETESTRARKKIYPMYKSPSPWTACSQLKCLLQKLVSLASKVLMLVLYAFFSLPIEVHFSRFVTSYQRLASGFFFRQCLSGCCKHKSLEFRFCESESRRDCVRKSVQTLPRNEQKILMHNHNNRIKNELFKSFKLFNLLDETANTVGIQGPLTKSLKNFLGWKKECTWASNAYHSSMLVGKKREQEWEREG